MTLGVIADDFTGAGDVANTLTRSGLETVILFAASAPPSGLSVDATVIALKTRSVPADDAIRQSLAALARLKALGCTQILFKICSTFDSTPRGNIGQVSEALAEALLWTGPVLVSPAFPGVGRTVFQGHLFVGDRLLSESGMERHPLNPMTDPDLRRWLAPQSMHVVGHLPLAILRRGSAAISQRLAIENGRGCRLIVADAIADEDLSVLGRTTREFPLLTGGSGLASGLALHHRRAGTPEVSSQGVDGPAAILSGSCSTATRAQVERHRTRQPALEVSIDTLMSSGVCVEDYAAFVLQHSSAQALVYSSADPAEVAAAQQLYGAAAIAARLDRFFGDLAVQLVRRGVTRLVVAGGETSGAVVSALGIGAVRVSKEVATGVPVLTVLDRPLALVLKSGNFGGPALFGDAIERMGGADGDRRRSA